MLNDTMSPAYHADGPALPGENVHQALAVLRDQRLIETATGIDSFVV